MNITRANQRAIELLTQYLSTARQTMIFTGAGISTASGIPDYRGPQGLWKTKAPIYYRDFMTSEKSRHDYWAGKTDDWLSFGDAAPNSVHNAIARLEKAGKLLSVVTQNIDGLHSKAGTTAQRLIELHGNNLMVECQSCRKCNDAAAYYVDFKNSQTVPICECGGFLKPATISFGQMLRADNLSRSRVAAENADLVIALGSTLSVYPASEFPLNAAERGVPYIIINSGETAHDGDNRVTLKFNLKVNDVFPPAVDAVISSPKSF